MKLEQDSMEPVLRIRTFLLDPNPVFSPAYLDQDPIRSQLWLERVTRYGTPVNALKNLFITIVLKKTVLKKISTLSTDLFLEWIFK